MLFWDNEKTKLKEQLNCLQAQYQQCKNELRLSQDNSIKLAQENEELIKQLESNQLILKEIRKNVQGTEINHYLDIKTKLLNNVNGVFDEDVKRFFVGLCENMKENNIKELCLFLQSYKKEKVLEKSKRKREISRLILQLRKITLRPNRFIRFMELLALCDENQTVILSQICIDIQNVRIKDITVFESAESGKLLNHGTSSYAFYLNLFRGVNNFEDALLLYCQNTPIKDALLYKERLWKYYEKVDKKPYNEAIRQLEKLILNKYKEL